MHGNPDVVKVRKQFADVAKCHAFEARVIRRMKQIDSGKWLNKAYWIGGGFHMSAEARAKMSEAKKGKKPWNVGLTKETDPRLGAVSLRALERGSTGRKISESHKQAIGSAWKGKKRPPRTAEHSAKIAAARKANNTASVKWGNNKAAIAALINK